MSDQKAYTYNDVQQQTIFTKDNSFLRIVKETDLKSQKECIKKFQGHYVPNRCNQNCRNLQHEYEISQKCLDLPLIYKYDAFLQGAQIFAQGKFEQGCALQMKFAKEKDFGELVYTKDSVITEELQKIECFKSYAIKMANAVLQLHSKNIAHNDVKDDNFFLFDYNFNNYEFDMQLSDFGFSAELDNQNLRSLQDQYKTYCSKNETTMAPEQRLVQQQKQNEPINEKLSDIYCLGICLFQVFTRVPYAQFFRQKKLQKYVDKMQYKKFQQLFPDNCQSLLDLNPQKEKQTIRILKLIFRLMNSDPSQRITLQNFIEALLI